MKLKNFFRQIPNTWVLRVKGMGLHAKKFEKMTKSRNLAGQQSITKPKKKVKANANASRLRKSLNYHTGGVISLLDITENIVKKSLHIKHAAP